MAHTLAGAIKVSDRFEVGTQIPPFFHSDILVRWCASVCVWDVLKNPGDLQNKTI